MKTVAQKTQECLQINMTSALKLIFPVLRDKVVCDNAESFRSPSSRVALGGNTAKQIYAHSSSAIQHTP